jgi:hypothetical protein
VKKSVDAVELLSNVEADLLAVAGVTHFPYYVAFPKMWRNVFARNVYELKSRRKLLPNTPVRL